MKTGLIQIYCGDGKGKTTASIGLAIRCIGGGGKVLLFQFMKNGKSGEINELKKIKGIEIIKGYEKIKFFKYMTEEEKEEATNFYRKTFDEIKGRIKEEKFDLLILDEILHAVNYEIIKEEDLIELLEEKPKGLEIVMTGRNPKERICERADYITEMKKIKHPFDKGIKARGLIEY